MGGSVRLSAAEPLTGGGNDRPAALIAKPDAALCFRASRVEAKLSAPAAAAAEILAAPPRRSEGWFHASP